MNDIEWTRHPAEAATAIGTDDDDPDTVGDGGMIGRLLIALALVFGSLGGVYLAALALS